MDSHGLCADKVVVKGRFKVRLLPALRRLLARVQRWLQVAHERRQLAALSDEALKDLGLNRGAVFEETERPFWDDPLDRQRK